MWGPIHVTMRLRRGLPSLRTPRTYRTLERCFRAGMERFECRVVHYSVMSNHLHLIVEADGTNGLSRFMQGLSIRIAKALNRLWRRRDSVFADRFFARMLETVTQIRRAVLYVLNNARKHAVPIPAGLPDRYSSARWYPRWCVGDGFQKPLRSPPVARARSFWDWALYPHLGVDELPGIYSSRETPNGTTRA